MDLPDIPPDPRIPVPPQPLTFEKGRKITEADFASFIGKSGVDNIGIAGLPNPEAVSPTHFLNDLAARGHMMTPVWGYAKLPDGYPQWTQFFLFGDGDGYAVTYGPTVRRFRLCLHEKESTLPAGFDPQRGWSPGYCKKCGLDMSVDSGD